MERGRREGGSSEGEEEEESVKKELVRREGSIEKVREREGDGVRREVKRVGKMDGNKK